MNLSKRIYKTKHTYYHHYIHIYIYTFGKKEQARKDVWISIKSFLLFTKKKRKCKVNVVIILKISGFWTLSNVSPVIFKNGTICFYRISTWLLSIASCAILKNYVNWLFTYLIFVQFKQSQRWPLQRYFTSCNSQDSNKLCIGRQLEQQIWCQKTIWEKMLF